MKENMIELINNTREYREMLLLDKYRPGYHFAIPDGDGSPGDPNGAFFADGRYHLMYLYRNKKTNAFHWGHMSSLDLLHWRNHPDAIGQYEGDEGCFSGGAFVDDDNTAYLSFWKFPSKDYTKDNGGIAIAKSTPPYEKWERIEPIAIEGAGKGFWGTSDYIDTEGNTLHLGCADPSNIWKRDGYYYMQTGSLCVMQLYGKDDARYRGDWVELYRSEDLKNWQYLHRFYERKKDNSWTNETEDDMCPSFLPLPSSPDGGMSDKYLQLFIAHNAGTQYYIGSYENDKFIPEKHGRFSYLDNTYFAPEALIDAKGRQIIWSWLLDDPNDSIEKYGWRGVYTLPTQVWLNESGDLAIRPVAELDNLQYNHQSFAPRTINGREEIDIKNGNSCRIKLTIDMKNAKKAGAYLRAAPEYSEKSEISYVYYDANQKQLVLDVTKSAINDISGRMIAEKHPLTLGENEKLSLDIFIDKSVVEVFANDRAVITRRVYNSEPAINSCVGLISEGSADYLSIEAFEMMPTNSY